MIAHVANERWHLGEHIQDCPMINAHDTFTRATSSLRGTRFEVTLDICPPDEERRVNTITGRPSVGGRGQVRRLPLSSHRFRRR